MTVKLYPVVNLTMKLPERARAFQINKTALATPAPGIDRCMKLDSLGTQLNLSTIVNSVLGNWNRHFGCNWYNFSNVAILSFHNDSGAQVKAETTATDLAVVINDQRPNTCLSSESR
jgi:hypothetical protein